MHISRAREEVRVLGKPVHHPLDQDSRFTSTQRHEFRSLGTGMVSYPMPSTSAALGHRHSDIESGGTSLDWSSNYKRPTADDSKFYSSPVSSNNASGRDDRFFPPIERPRDMQSIPGLGNYDRPVPDRTVAPSESTRPKYTSESAANILLHFGLEKEDLEELLSYPEDQITPANLPYILRQIRIQKAKRTTTTVQTKSYPESVSERDSHSLSSSGSSSVLQPSKVIDYGHTGKYTGGVVDDTGKTSVSRANSGGSGSMLLMDNFSSSRHTREPPPKSTTVVKSSALGSSQQASSVTSLSSSYSPVLNLAAPPSHDQTKQLQTSQANLSSFVLPKKDTDLRVLKAEVSKPVPVKEPEADRQSTSKTQPPCTPLFRGVHPSRPGLVVIGSNNNSGTKGQSKTQGHGSTVPGQIKKQQSQQQKPKQPVEHQSKEQMQKQPGAQPGQANWPPVFSAAKPVPPTPLNPNITDASRPMQRMMFLPDDPRSMVIPPLLPQPMQNFNHMTLPPSSRQPPAKVAVTKGLPTLAMMHDYAAASPRIFPHTCSLCNKECTHLKSLSKQSDLDTVVKTLAPVLLAELVKMKSSSSSSSSSSSKGGKPSSSTTPAGGKRLSSTASSSSSSSTAKKKVLLTKASKAKPSLQKSQASSSKNTKFGKSSPPTMVRLEGVRNSLSHNDVIAAVEQFGKTKSVLLFRSKFEAIVCFEKEEDAKKLRAAKSLDVKGLPVSVVREKKTDSKDQKKTPLNKPVSSSASRPQTISTTKITTSRKGLLPPPSVPPVTWPLVSGAQKATTGKLTNQKTAPKGSVKGLMTVTKAKVLVSKAKNISTKQMAKMVKTGKLPAKGPLKKAAVKQKTSTGSKQRASENQSKAGDSKQKPIATTSETSVKESLVVLEETDKIEKSKNITLAEATTDKDIVTKEKLMASQAEMASAAQESKTSVEKLAAAGAVAKEKVEETAAKADSVPSENHPDVETSRPKESETKVKEAVEVPKDTAKVVEPANVTEIEPKHQAKLDEANRN
ncbi:hypothetical protein GBF38_005157 [Nibea albiflora]|uniref:Uncharacterized protein n=1 Tax=Nibea albiflora TaxID=240163 RepID=A0ACB7EZ26_NIBAL|nr:hypothetical protein GBF38_005157 [Nibea albiflora]